MNLAAASISAPEPATPTVAAPAPMNLAAASISRLGADVCNEEAGTKAVKVGRTTGLVINCGRNVTRAALLNTGKAVFDKLYMASGEMETDTQISNSLNISDYM